MSTIGIIVIAILVLAVIAVAAYYAMREQRTRGLQQRFGPEYDRTVEMTGGRGKAEAELSNRAERVKRLEIRPLTPEAQAEFSERWVTVQALFVDEPATALGQADALVAEVMRERGYPVQDFEQRAADVSVDHPGVVENYRAGHRISQDARANQADTEDMRRGIVHYRALFTDLLGGQPQQAEQRQPARRPEVG